MATEVALVETPPAGTPAMKSFNMPSPEQVQDWVARQEAMTVQLQKLERQTAAMEANKVSLERQAAAMEEHGRQMAKFIAAMNTPVKSAPTTTASIVESLCVAMAPVTSLSEKQVVDRAREIARLYRQYHPSTLA